MSSATALSTSQSFAMGVSFQMLAVLGMVLLVTYLTMEWHNTHGDRKKVFSTINLLWMGALVSLSVMNACGGAVFLVSGGGAGEDGMERIVLRSVYHVTYAISGSAFTYSIYLRSASVLRASQMDKAAKWLTWFVLGLLMFNCIPLVIATVQFPNGGAPISLSIGTFLSGGLAVILNILYTTVFFRYFYGSSKTLGAGQANSAMHESGRVIAKFGMITAAIQTVSLILYGSKFLVRAKLAESVLDFVVRCGLVAAALSLVLMKQSVAATKGKMAAGVTGATAPTRTVLATATTANTMNSKEIP